MMNILRLIDWPVRERSGPLPTSDSKIGMSGWSADRLQGR